MKNIYRRCAALAAAAGSLSACGREAPRTLPTELTASDASDTRAQRFEDADGRLDLDFESAREDGPGAADIYQTVLRDDGSFAPPWLVPELSTPFVERGPTLSRDGLELILASNRPGTLGQLDH